MQAARGTSVAPGSSHRLRPVFFGVAVTAYAVDQVTKALAVAKLDGRPDVSVVGDLLQLHLTRNPGAAFSLGTDFTPVLSVVAIVAALAVLWFARKAGSLGWACALGFLMAGVTGNLTDRIVRPPGVLHGHVIDFLQLPNWPIFNVADMCINVAAALIVILAFRGIRLDGTRESEDETGDTGETSTDSSTGSSTGSSTATSTGTSPDTSTTATKADSE